MQNSFSFFFTSESPSSELKVTLAHLTVKFCKRIQIMMKVGYGPLNVHFKPNIGAWGSVVVKALRY